MARVLFHTEAIAPPLTGIGRYAAGLGAALAADGGSPPVACRPRCPSVDVAPARIGYRWRRRLRGVPGAYTAQHALSVRRFRRLAAEEAWALYHEPNFVLRPFDGPTVVTCHDLAHVRFPAQQPPRRRAFLDRHLSDSLARADRVIVPTRFIRDELAEVHGLGPERVRVVPEGVDPGFRPRAAAETAAPLARHGLRPGGYLLSVGTLEPRKNLETLVAAVADLPATVRRRWPLVLVGAPGWRDSGLAGRLAPLVREGSAKVLGHVPDPDLRALYAGARGVAYLSTYEGFGLPCLEAMASGAPLLISTAPALREVTAGAGLEAPAGDVDAVRQQLQRLLEDTALRVDLACRGRDRAAGLTWLAAASATRAVYAEVLAPATAAPPREAA